MQRAGDVAAGKLLDRTQVDDPGRRSHRRQLRRRQQQGVLHRLGDGPVFHSVHCIWGQASCTPAARQLAGASAGGAAGALRPVPKTVNTVENRPVPQPVQNTPSLLQRVAQ